MQCPHRFAANGIEPLVVLAKLVALIRGTEWSPALVDARQVSPEDPEAESGILELDTRLREDLDSRGTVRLSTDVALEGDALIRQARAEADRIIAEAEARTGTLSRDTQWKAGMGRFLSREKEFLQSLASLIQGHAERVKEDAQRARDELAPLIAESEAEVNRMREPYERIYRRCLAMPIARDTFPALLPARSES